MLCPHCRQTLTRVGNFWICPDHGQIDPAAVLQPDEAAPASRPRLFLSYGRRDAARLAERLAAELEAQGFEVWMDRSALRAARDWQAQIVDGLRSAQIVIALLSPHAVRVSADPANPDALDSVCLDEISFARFSRPPKPIVPVMAAPCEPPFCIFRLDWVDLVAWEESEGHYRAGFDRLMEALEDALRGKPRYRWDFLKPWDFAAFLYDKRRDFVGRQWLFAELDGWLRRGREAALLITGDPGVGKSAIVAELVHRNPGGKVLAYHCCLAGTRETLKPGRFVRSLAAMIASQLQDYAAQLEHPDLQDLLSETAAAQDPLSAFEAGVLNPLQALPAPGDGVRLLLIDALDEALLLGERTTIVEVLARRLSRLPPWLRIVATTRREPEVLESLQGLTTRTLNAQDPRNLLDLKSYLARRLGDPPLDRLRQEAGLPLDKAVGLLAAKSAGNFLFVHQALEGLERGIYDFARLDEMPPGLGSLYLHFFSRHFPDPAAFAPVRRLLEVAAAAQEPLPAELLAGAAGLDPEEELPRLLRRLAAYLPERDGRYAFFHKSLADWLTDPARRGADYAVNPRRGHQALAEMGWREYQENVAGLHLYFLAHLPRHLAEAGRGEDLRGLLLDYDWLQAKLAAQGITALIADYDLAPDDKDLHLIQGALRLSAHVVASTPANWPAS
jgi:hypothetical protein